MKWIISIEKIGAVSWQKLPHLKLPVAYWMFLFMLSPSSEPQRWFQTNPTAPTAEATKIVVFAVVLCFFSEPNLVWSLDYTTRPSQRERAQPKHLAEHQRF